jgi:hypothetical protein
VECGLSLVPLHSASSKAIENEAIPVAQIRQMPSARTILRFHTAIYSAAGTDVLAGTPLLRDPLPCTHPRKRRFAHTGKDCAAVKILCWHFCRLTNYKAITLKFPAGEGRPHKALAVPGYRPQPFMKCFSNRCFDRSAPSSVSITDFALLTGSSM